jgi:hypothetical protein
MHERKPYVVSKVNFPHICQVEFIRWMQTENAQIVICLRTSSIKN